MQSTLLLHLPALSIQSAETSTSHVFQRSRLLLKEMDQAAYSAKLESIFVNLRRTEQGQSPALCIKEQNFPDWIDAS